MELLNIAELGATVVLDVIVLFLVCRYLPQRDKQFLETMEKTSRQMNRLVSLWVNQLENGAKKKQDMSDEVFSDKKEKKDD